MKRKAHYPYRSRKTKKRATRGPGYNGAFNRAVVAKPPAIEYVFDPYVRLNTSLTRMSDFLSRLTIRRQGDR